MDGMRHGSHRRPLNLALIGMPGSGKSTLGRRVARDLAMEFLDTDVLIEEYERRPITEIFKEDGEAYFRRLESLVIETVQKAVASRAPGAPAGSDAERSGSETAASPARGLILSVGGGAAENPDNVARLRELGVVVFIDRPLEALEKSIAYNGNRPLLSDREKLVEQYGRRAPLYAEAADRIISNDGDFDIAAEELLLAARLMGAADDYLVIGDPIAHTLSPRLHAALFDELRKGGAAGAPAEGVSYGAARVTPERLEVSMGDLRAGSVRGFNVTIPHKKAVIPFLDETRGDAALAGAVNTVLREGDRLVGHNTDMEGLRLALKARGRSYAAAVVTVCGTGGAAAGVACKAAACGAAKLYLLGRNEAEAARIAEIANAAAVAGSAAAGSVQPADAPESDDLTQPAPLVEFVRHDFAASAAAPRLTEALAETDLLINATPFGMEGAGLSFATAPLIGPLREGAFVYDLVYKPEETALLRAARGRGLDAEGGMSMLVYQGILSDELFFGVETDREALCAAARDIIGLPQTLTVGE